MGTILASEIVRLAAVQLTDLSHVRWKALELLDYLNDGQLAICVVRPQSCAKWAAIQLEPGTLQSLPPDGIALLDVAYNVSTDGKTPGRAVRITQRAELDARSPGWHGATASAVVQHYIPVEHDPKTFFVYPPNTGAGRVRVAYGAAPAKIKLEDAITLGDIYQPVLIDYLVYRAHTKDTTAADAAKAQRAYQAFATALGFKHTGEASIKPKDTAPASGPLAG